MPLLRIPITPLALNDGPSVGGTAVLTDATPLPEGVIPARLLIAGGTLHVKVAGRMTTTATPGTLIFGLYLAKSGVAIGSGVNLAATSTITPTASVTNRSWRAEFIADIQSVGAGGAGVGQAKTIGWVDNIRTDGTDYAPATAPWAAVSIDTTADQRVLFGVTPSSTVNTVIVHNILAEVIGIL